MSPLYIHTFKNLRVLFLLALEWDVSPYSFSYKLIVIQKMRNFSRGNYETKMSIEEKEDSVDTV